MTFDLGVYVELTELGKRWAHQIARLEDKDSLGKRENREADAGPETNTESGDRNAI